MRILLLCEGNAETHDSWSGVSRSLLGQLRAAGHTVVAGDVDLHGTHRFLLAARTATWPRRRWWVRYHLSGAAFEARSREAARRIAEVGRDFDLVLQIGATFQVPRGLGVPLVLYCDSNINMAWANAQSGFTEASSLTERELQASHEREAEVYRRADRICTMSERLLESFASDFAIPRERLVTIHCAPNFDVQAIDLPPPQAARPPTVLFVGRDFRRKGGDLLLRAFPEVRRRVPGARLLMVGAKGAGGRQEGLEFAGYLSRDTESGRQAMDRAYRDASVFCLPTRFEPFGTAFVEAMAYGLPCVGPKTAAVPEIIVHERTGLLVPPEDPTALAEALVRLLGDPELAQRMGREARARVLEHFTWPRVVGRMLESIEPIVASRRNA